MRGQGVGWSLSSDPEAQHRDWGCPDPRSSPWPSTETGDGRDDLRASATGPLGSWYPRKSKNSANHTERRKRRKGLKVDLRIGWSSHPHCTEEGRRREAGRE